MRVAVLMGGRSLERQVSLKSGSRVAEALAHAGHEVTGIDVGHDLVARLRACDPQIAFIALHGRDGEDGTVQELLDALGVPYTGSGPAACAMSWDKALAKHHLRSAGIPTPDARVFSETALKELGAADALADVAQSLSFPVVVKPTAQGSALGIRIAKQPSEVPGALIAAFSYGDRVLLERHVAGRDLAVSVLGGEALPVVEATPEGDVYDFEARYTIGASTFRCPADIPEATAIEAQRLAVAVFELLQLEGCARIDLLLDEAGDLWVLEANAVPGFTDTSLLPQAAEAAGISFAQLCERMLELAQGA